MVAELLCSRLTPGHDMLNKSGDWGCVMSDEESFSTEEIELAIEKAYRRGFHQALVLLATFYARGVSHAELTRLANEHMAWRRELGGGQIMDSAMPHYMDAVSPLERHQRGKA